MNNIDAQARKLLLARRNAIRKTLAHNVEDEHALREGGEADLLDRASSTENALLLQTLSHAERDELVQIDAALKRIADGKYGDCAECGGPIGRQRLLAIPEARLCIACTEESEQATGAPRTSGASSRTT